MLELNKLTGLRGGLRTPFDPKPTPPITLEVTPEMMATLQQISHDSKQSLDIIFTHAIALYRAAIQATAEGKHVGYATSSDALEVEFTGLAGTGSR